VPYSQKLTIDTPEQISLEYEIAGPGSRFMALFVDLMIQVIAAILLMIVLLITGFSFVGRGSWALLVYVLAAFLFQWGYFAIFEIVWKGQTPGKRQAGIRVINETGRGVSVYESVARNLLRAVDSLPGVYALGAVVMFISPQQKRLGDYVAGTVVIHDREPDDDAIFFNTNDEIPEGINYSALTPNDLQLIETFLQRRLDIEYDVREKTAAKLADHFRMKCEASADSYKDNENFLELLVRGYRRGARFHLR
jgi:uncharacterized RDD family membrane protein YckC